MSQTKKEEVSTPTPIQQVPVTSEKKQEPIVEEINTPDDEFLLSILLDANKDLKIADQIIYNKLDLFVYEPDKRKFYQMLINTELFASNKDAIVIAGNKTQCNDINSKTNNVELYRFLNEEFGIDKMVYAIDDEQKSRLINLYKSNRNSAKKTVVVEKYHIETTKKENTEDKLRGLFGDEVKIEE